jgi:hypothetical protein
MWERQEMGSPIVGSSDVAQVDEGEVASVVGWENRRSSQRTRHTSVGAEGGDAEKREWEWEWEWE